MLHVFIINPAANSGTQRPGLVADIESYFHAHGGAYEIRYTAAPGEGERLAREYVQTGSPVRLYACGGDGTLHEVVNGAYGYPNAEIGAVPCGRCNHFIKAFSGYDFSSISGQVTGSALPVDLVQVNDRLVCNACCLGLDPAAVGCDLPGSLSRRMTEFYALYKARAHYFLIEPENGVPMEGGFLYLTAANCPWYGDILPCVSTAQPFDGLFDFLSVGAESRLKRLYLASGKEEPHHTIQQMTGAVITSKKSFPLLLDGEKRKADRVKLKIIEKGMPFIIPSVKTEKPPEQERQKQILFSKGRKAAPVCCEGKMKNYKCK